MSNCQVQGGFRVLRSFCAWRKCSITYRALTGSNVSRQVHTGNTLYKSEDDSKNLEEKMSATPYPFMSSLKGNIKVRQESFEYEEEWKHQGLVIFGSISAFMLYFVLLRKEREVDRAIEKTLYQGLPALEVYDLRKAIKKGKDDGKDVSELEERLKVVLTPPQNRRL